MLQPVWMCVAWLSTSTPEMFFDTGYGGGHAVDSGGTTVAGCTVAEHALFWYSADIAADLVIE